MSLVLSKHAWLATHHWDEGAADAAISGADVASSLAVVGMSWCIGKETGALQSARGLLLVSSGPGGVDMSGGYQRHCST